MAMAVSRAVSQRTARRSAQIRQVAGDDERYTPPYLLDLVEAFLGRDYVDPCPPSYGRVPVVNGLSTPWKGRIYCNPPYSDITPWVRKAMTEPLRECILLLPASTDTKWFRPLSACTLCFVAGRLIFYDRQGLPLPHHAPHPSILAYRGYRPRKFAQHFAAIGFVMRPERGYNSGRRSLFEGM